MYITNVLRTSPHTHPTPPPQKKKTTVLALANPLHYLEKPKQKPNLILVTPKKNCHHHQRFAICGSILVSSSKILLVCQPHVGPLVPQSDYCCHLWERNLQFYPYLKPFYESKSSVIFCIPSIITCHIFIIFSL